MTDWSFDGVRIHCGAADRKSGQMINDGLLPNLSDHLTDWSHDSTFKGFAVTPDTRSKQLKLDRIDDQQRKWRLPIGSSYIRSRNQSEIEQHWNCVQRHLDCHGQGQLNKLEMRAQSHSINIDHTNLNNIINEESPVHIGVVDHGFIDQLTQVCVHIHIKMLDNDIYNICIIRKKKNI